MDGGCIRVLVSRPAVPLAGLLSAECRSTAFLKLRKLPLHQWVTAVFPAWGASGG